MANERHIEAGGPGNAIQLHPHAGVEDRLRGGGDPPYDGGMEARVAVLEEIAKSTKEILVEIKGDVRDILRDQKSDFRLLFGALIAVALGLAGLMARGFHWL